METFVPRRTLWMCHDDTRIVGDVGFLVKRTDVAHGVARYELRDAPLRGGIPVRALLYGYCGTCDNIITDAQGVAKVILIASDGRLCVKELTGVGQVAALEELGYLELVRA